MAEKNTASVEKAGRPLGAALFGLAALCLGAFATVSVFGYCRTDPNLFLPEHAPDAPIANRCGMVGANLAYHLISVYGLAGFAVPVLVFFWGFHVLVRKRLEAPWRRLAGAALAVAALATVLGAASGGGGWLHDRVAGLNVPVPRAGAPRAGGLLGYLCASLLLPGFGPVGIYLVAGAGGLLGAVLISPRSLEWALVALGRGTLAALRGAGARWAARRQRRTAVVAARAASARALVPAMAAAAEPDEAEARSRRARAPSDEPSIRARFGQSEEDMRRAALASRPVPARPAPVVTIARVTEVPPEPDDECDRREKREIAALQARASGSVPAAETPGAPRVSEAPAERPVRGPAERPAARPAEKPAEKPVEQADAPPEPPVPDPVVRNMSAACPSGQAGPADEERPAPRAARPPARRPAAPAALSRRDAAERSPAAPPAPPAPDYSRYELPKVDLLDRVAHQTQVTNEVLTGRGQVLVDALKEFKIATRLVSIDRGPAVTIYELELAPGIRVQRVMELSDNLAMAMRAPNVRIIAPIPGRDSIGVEVPNTEREVVRLRPIIESKEFAARTKEMAVPFVIGRDAAGEVLAEDLTRMPHLLVAGATGSGKSVCLNSFIGTILMTRTPAQVRLLLVDPKMVEMNYYKGIPHLITPVITDMKRAASVFEWAIGKMEERYEMLSNCGVRDIARYNRLGGAERVALAEAADAEDPSRYSESMPYLVIIVDELADLMMLAGKEIERSITRLAQKSRGVGIHIILATQRPSVDVVTGLIKTNMPARIAFQVASKVDSRTIIDQNGAEKLMGMGDMLYLPPAVGGLVRAKGTYVTDEEVHRMVDHSRGQAPQVFAPELESLGADGGAGGAGGGPGGGLDDDLFDEAVRVVLETRRGSVSLLQRRLGVGYTRAAKLIDMMAERSILGPYRGSKPREIQITIEEWEAGALSSGPVAGQRGDERPPEDIPDADDYNESEEFPEHGAAAGGESEEEEPGEREPETAGSVSGRFAS